MSRAQIGLVGLAVMGENLALNIAEKGFPIAVFNRTVRRVDEFLARNPDQDLVGCHTIAELAGAVERPRRIIVMVKAGDAVDQQMALLAPYLDPGDIVIDAGNSWFLDTERRVLEYAARGFEFCGMGVSGGEEGARHGPSMMPGGSPEAYSALEPVLTKVAAQVDDGPCVAYIGRGGAGHYVKMVHNGIEYGDMQLIAEAYDLLTRIGGLNADELADVFDRWNEGELQSYLIEITAAILRRRDERTGRPLVEMILDTAGQKGTGKWTSQNALDVGSPIPTINAAVDSRLLSALKKERTAAAELFPGPGPVTPPGSREDLVNRVRDALYAAKICTYAQGMALLARAGEMYGWELNLAELARIWKGGCIIRARLLDRISAAFRRQGDLANLLLADGFRDEVASRQLALRSVLSLGIQAGVPMLATSAALGYYDLYRSARLPANLLQAQRDFFGAHTYQRVDMEGVFHTEWTRPEEQPA